MRVLFPAVGDAGAIDWPELADRCGFEIDEDWVQGLRAL
jgi:hypothetical protein